MIWGIERGRDGEEGRLVAKQIDKEVEIIWALKILGVDLKRPQNKQGGCLNDVFGAK